MNVNMHDLVKFETRTGEVLEGRVTGFPPEGNVEVTPLHQPSHFDGPRRCYPTLNDIHEVMPRTKAPVESFADIFPGLVG